MKWDVMGLQQTGPLDGDCGLYSRIASKSRPPPAGFASCLLPGRCANIRNDMGEMSERLKEHDWKSCVLATTGSEGSNPSLSAMSAFAMLRDLDFKVAGPCAT